MAPEALASPVSIFKNIFAASKTKANVYHVTGDIHYVVLALPKKKTILTIHDCIFLHRSKGIKRVLLKWLFLKLPISRSQIVTTISEATKQDILNNINCKPEKIVVIPNPVDDKIFFTPAVFRANKPVILFIGNTTHKNLARAIPALQNIHCTINIIGKLADDMIALLKQYQIEFINEYNLSDEEMALRYTTSDMVLFPSTFEGFGLPVIESQKAGRPVITSNISPLKEVAGGAACLVDPLDINSIRNGVLKIINDKDYRNKLVEDGFKNASLYSADNIALQYLDCYKKILKN